MPKRNGMLLYGTLRLRRGSRPHRSVLASPTYPRDMGPLIPLCLHYRVEAWFIPIAKPWRNGIVKKFSEHYSQKFLGRVRISSSQDLRPTSLAFEYKHNNSYHYSNLQGPTLLQGLAERSPKLIFSPQKKAPSYPSPKPSSGRYHLIRFIRPDLRLNVFGSSSLFLRS